ncbi:MAG: hypothetical protein WBV73_26905 [Phormidium sp.]
MITAKKRPATLDKRVFFRDDYPGLSTIQQRNLLDLRLSSGNGSAKYRWELTFDLLNSGKDSCGVNFTKEEFATLIQLFELKSFDWKNRTLSDCTSFFYYRYLSLDDAIAVANQVAEFAYQLHNEPLNSVAEKLRHQEKSTFRVHICGEKSSQYQLSAAQELKLEILLFQNGRISTKRGNQDMGLVSGYPRDRAIATLNPNREDGVLLINHNVRQAEFFPTDWNTFCLQVDRRALPIK